MVLIVRLPKLYGHRCLLDSLKQSELKTQHLLDGFPIDFLQKKKLTNLVLITIPRDKAGKYVTQKGRGVKLLIIPTSDLNALRTFAINWIFT